MNFRSNLDQGYNERKKEKTRNKLTLLHLSPTCRVHANKTMGRATLLDTYLVFDRVGGVLLLLAFLVWSAHIQVLHVGGENLRHTNPWQNAHDWSQNQHQSYLRRKRRGSVLMWILEVLVNPIRWTIGVKMTYHDSWEVHAGDSIHDDEYPRIRQVVKAVVKTNCN